MRGKRIGRICRKIFTIILSCVVLGIFAVSVYQIYAYYHEASENHQEYEDLAKIAREDEPSNQPKEENNADSIISGNEFQGYQELYAQNSDFVGWIHIDGTQINYPVMQTPRDPNFYLHRNFQKRYSAYGVPFLQSDCVVGQSDNLVIYGHHMNDGSMFAALDQYKSREFYESHKYIQFNTLTEAGTYEVVSAFKTSANSGFQYYNFVQASNQAEFDSYIEKCQALAFYDTGVTAAYGEHLITLSTCEYSLRNGRVVVVAKQVR